MGEVARFMQWCIRCFFASVAFVPFLNAFAQTNASFQPIQIVDSGWYLVRISGDDSPSGRYRVVELLKSQIAPGGKFPGRPSMLEIFAVDCENSRGIKRMQRAFNLEADPTLPVKWGQHTEEGFDKSVSAKDIVFEGLNAYAIREQKEVDRVTQETLGKTYPPLLPVPSTLAAEFACRVSAGPESAKLVASDLERTGALTDLKEVTCEIDFEGGRPPMEQTLKFSESIGAAQWAGVWKRYVTVSPDTVKFKDTKFRFSINRTSGRLSVVSIADESVELSGNCVSASDRPRKF